MEKKQYQEQNMKSIKASSLLAEVRDLKASGYRLVQVCAINVEKKVELLYTFDKDHNLLNIKVDVPAKREMESITKEYFGAFIYENEMNDLFGIKFKHNQLDFGGKFFVTSEPTPWKKK